MRAALSRLVGPPMAAPETTRLRALRLTILGVSLALGLLAALIGPATRVIGPGAAGAAGGLLVALVVLVPIYIRAKTRADAAFLTAQCRDGER